MYISTTKRKEGGWGGGVKECFVVVDSRCFDPCHAFDLCYHLAINCVNLSFALYITNCIYVSFTISIRVVPFGTVGVREVQKLQVIIE